MPSETSVENYFAAVMKSKSEAELQRVIANKEKYEFEACIAAFEELERRQLATQELLQDKAQYIEKENVRRQQELTEPAAPQLSIIDLFKFRPNYIFTPLLVYANVLIFIMMVATGVDAFTPTVESLINWGGNVRGLTLNGELWRLFTCTFLHGGIIHLAFNMYALLQVGFFLETNIGKSRYVVTYVATGILASVTSIMFNENIVSVGASGAIFGLEGLLLALLITRQLNIQPEYRNNLLTSTLVFVGYSLMFGFSKEGIDNAAHIGGLITGFVIGLIYSFSLKRAASATLASCAIVGFALVVAVLSPLFITNKYGEYQTVMETFALNEEKALWMYKESMPVGEDTVLYNHRLKTEGIDVWKENLAILNSLTDMPEHLRRNIDLLKKYCQLRIQSCQAMKQSIMDAGLSNGKVLELDTAINAVIEELQAANK